MSSFQEGGNVFLKMPNMALKTWEFPPFWAIWGGNSHKFPLFPPFPPLFEALTIK